MRYCERCRATFQALRKCPKDGIATRADIADPLIEHVLGERYRVLERIAAGGMGQVYRAAHTRIASLFAVKVLYGDICYEPEMRARFAREAEVVSYLQSRQIVRVMDFGEDDLLYIAMEYLDGPTLESVITRDDAFSPSRAIAIAKQIARGLAHAHERGVVHRDLKSSNVILVAEDDEPELVKLLDFGLAHIGGRERLTQVGMVMGTPHYMAPEQFMAAETDARTDLYALGVILYEMLSGNLPFDTPSIEGIRESHMQKQPPSLTARSADRVGRPLEALVLRLMAKRPEDRFPSARALLEALDRVDQPAATWQFDSEPTLPGSLRELRVAEPIRAAIQAGAPAYNRGDHAACFQVYRQTAQQLLADALSADVATAAAARLEVALNRAEHLDSTRAAWEMRYAFDDLLNATSLDLHGELDAVAAEVAVLTAITTPRYAAGHLDLVGDYHLLFAERLAQRLTKAGGHATICAALESMVAMGRRAGGGQRALGVVSGVLESLRNGSSPSSMAMPSGTQLLSCPNLESVAHHLTRAIAVGAPAYNAGQIDACFRIYRQSAVEALAALSPDVAAAAVRQLLEDAIRRADDKGADDAAWTMRHAFDQLLAASATRAPPSE